MIDDILLAVQQTYTSCLDRDTIEAVVACLSSHTCMHVRCKEGGKYSKSGGGRGTTVCEAWTEPVPYVRWALTDGDYAKDLTCDRRDNGGNYDPGNCYYVTAAEQNQNTRATKLSMIKAREIRTLDQYLSQVELAEIYGVGRKTISDVICNRTWLKLEPVFRPIWVVSDEEILNIIRLHRDWQAMQERVTPGYVHHEHYYDKGVIMCREWYNFATYYMWAVENGSRHGLTIDRIDNNGNYCPENCWFATKAEQNRNRCDTTLPDKKLVYQIETICDNMNLSDSTIGQIYDVGRHIIRKVRRGAHWNSDKGTGVRVRGDRTLPDKKLVYQIEAICDNTKLRLIDIAKIYDVSHHTIRRVRHRKHWNSDPVV